MQVLFLGTSAGKPTNHRNVTSIAVILQDSEFILIDCGEATQHQIMKSSLKITKLKAIHITHLHGDHIFGLPGLLCSLNNVRKDPITIYGPSGLKTFLDFTIKQINTYTVNVKEYNSINRNTLQTKHLSGNYEYSVDSAQVYHRIPCFAYKITQTRITEQIDMKYLYPHLDLYRNELENMGFSPAERIIPFLKKGASFTMNDGFIFNGNNYILKTNEVSLVIALDNCDSKNMCFYFKNCDVLIHDCTYALMKSMSDKEKKEITQLAYSHKHSTNQMAFSVARMLKCNHLILTHFSSRYDFKDEEAIIKGCVEEKDEYLTKDMKIECARDFSQFCIHNK